MPANIPNLGSINTVGEQFKHNVFKDIHAKTVKQGIRNNLAAKKTAATRTNARQTWANGVDSTLKTAQAANQKQQKAHQAAAMTAQKAHAAGVNKGTQAPAQGAPPRTFAVPTSPAQKQATAQKAQVASQAQKTMQQQRNYAHGQAITEGNQRTRAAAKVNTPPKIGAKKPVAKPVAGQFPQAVHPGSSTQALPNATAKVSTEAAPQTISVGSWTAKPGGIASAGSHLEAWANTKSRAVQARRKSQAAGGRDRTLAAAAKEWESAASQPLGNKEE